MENDITDRRPECGLCGDEDNGIYDCRTCGDRACGCCIGLCEGCGDLVCARCADPESSLDPGCPRCVLAETARLSVDQTTHVGNTGN